jgi:hypothetical protein
MGYHLTNINLQLLKSSGQLPFPAHPPSQVTVSGERVAPKPMQRTAKARTRFSRGRTLKKQNKAEGIEADGSILKMLNMS